MRVKIGDVERAIGPPRHRDRAEVLVRAGRQGFMPLRLVDRALRLELIPVRANVALAVIYDESTLRLLREVTVADEFASGGDGTTWSERQVISACLLFWVDERCRDGIHWVILPGRGIEQDPATPVIEDFAVGIPERVGHRNLQLMLAWSVAKDGRIADPPWPERRFDLRVVKYPLGKIERAVRAPAEVVHRVLGVLGTKPVQHGPHPISLAVSTGVLCKNQIRHLRHESATAIGERETMDQLHLVEEHRVFVGDTIAILVLEDHERIHRLFPRQRMRPGRGITDPQATLRIETDRKGIRDWEALL